MGQRGGGATGRAGMRGALLLGAASCLEGAMAQDTGGPFKGSEAISKQTPGHCVDNRGMTIPEGMLFEPGPDQCQVCTCLRQLPVLCRTVLCGPPQGCLSVRAGDGCCQWFCDRWEDEGSQVSDLGLRLVASAVTAILSLSLLFFLIYRLRQRKLRSRQNHLEAEDYSGGGGQVSLGEEISLPELDLKPDDRLTLQRPFPPSYDEAVFGSCEGNIGPMAEEDTEFEAPPYSSIQHDPVISYPAISDPDGLDQATSLPPLGVSLVSYPVATLGRLVLPAPPLVVGSRN